MTLCAIATVIRAWSLAPGMFSNRDLVGGLCYNAVEDAAMRYRAVIEPGRESGYVAYVPALKGCVSQGQTPEEAFANIREAAEAYVESRIEDNLPLPPEVEVRELEIEAA